MVVFVFVSMRFFVVNEKTTVQITPRTSINILLVTEHGEDSHIVQPK